MICILRGIYLLLLSCCILLYFEVFDYRIFQSTAVLVLLLRYSSIYFVMMNDYTK